MAQTRQPLFLMRVSALAALAALEVTFLVPTRVGAVLEPIDPSVTLSAAVFACWVVVAILRKVTNLRWVVAAELIGWAVSVVVLLRTLPAEAVTWVGDVPERSVMQRLLETLQTFAWPLAVLVAVIVLRVPIASLLARVENFQGLGTSVNFARGAEDLRQDAASLVGEVKAQETEDRGADRGEFSPRDGSDSSEQQPSPMNDSNAENHEFDRGAQRDTEYFTLSRREFQSERDALLPTILTNWAVLERNAERALHELADLHMVQLPAGRGQRPSIRLAFRVLSDRGMLPTYVMDVVQRAQQLRNELVHNPARHFSAESLRDLLEATNDIQNALDAGMTRARELG